MVGHSEATSCYVIEGEYIIGAAQVSISAGYQNIIQGRLIAYSSKSASSCCRLGRCR